MLVQSFFLITSEFYEGLVTVPDSRRGEAAELLAVRGLVADVVVMLAAVDEAASGNFGRSKEAFRRPRNPSGS